jgi:hypothetical protein
MLCSLLDIYRRFGGTRWFYLPAIRLHVVAFPKKVFFIVTTVRTSIWRSLFSPQRLYPEPLWSIPHSHISFIRIHIIIIVPFTYRSLKWFLPFRFSNQNSVCIFLRCIKTLTERQYTALFWLWFHVLLFNFWCALQCLGTSHLPCSLWSGNRHFHLVVLRLKSDFPCCNFQVGNRIRCAHDKCTATCI